MEINNYTFVYYNDQQCIAVSPNGHIYHTKTTSDYIVQNPRDYLTFTAEDVVTVFLQGDRHRACSDIRLATKGKLLVLTFQYREGHVGLIFERKELV
jgi:hypothetical protein